MRIPVLLSLLLAGPLAQEKADLSGKISAVEGAAQQKLRARIKYAGPGVAGRKAPAPSPAVVWLEGAPRPPAAPAPAKAEILQEGLEFRPRVLAVPLGSTVSFPNGDDLTHNVFSYSKAKRFDLGRYAKGQTQEVVFDAAGLVDVRCEVHDHMRAAIHVFDHPWFAVAAEDGAFRIPDVPPGSYVLVVWKEFFTPRRVPVEVKAGGARVDVALSFGGDAPDEAVRPGALAACCGSR
jgi:plastocyanin